MIDQMYLMLFNLLFTSLPPLAVGVFDRDAPADLLSSSPPLYSVGRLSTVYKPYSFWINMADALYQSLVVFFVAFGAFTESDIGLWEFGTMVCSQCVVVMLLQLGVETKSWTIVHWLGVTVSVVLYLAFGLTYNAVCSQCEGLTNPYLVMQNSLADPTQWAVLLLSGLLSVLPRVAGRVVQNTLYPSDVIIAVKRRRLERDQAKARKNALTNEGGFMRFFSRSSSSGVVGETSMTSSSMEDGQGADVSLGNITEMTDV